MRFAMRFMAIAAVAMVLSSLAPSVVSTAQAQDLKIAHADAELVLVYLPEYKSIGAKVQRQVQSSQEIIEAKANEFQTDYQTFEKQSQLLPAEKRAERESELSQRYVELQQFSAQKEQEVARFEADLMNPLIKKVQDAVDAIAAEKGIDIVLKSPGILYVNPDTIIDITADVASRLGVDLKKELSANADN